MTGIYGKLASLWRPRPPVLRPNRIGDAAECARLHRESFRHGWSVEDFQRFSIDKQTLGHVAHPHGQSSLHGAIFSRMAADEAEILTIMVAKAARNQGLGRQLLMRHLAELASLGTHHLFLEVEAGNKPALALYQRFYFRQVGERPGYYAGADGKKSSALLLRCDFH
ncbi:MAG: GNAT family N-acetyltransferase [Hyphomicrobiales bacterium]|nr:GNAT family N-acetyltransferase [Hyphomicrobiales bacterium]MDE2114152.1 GNAT family N-acetyltransferase [Hyphomicrobiales bacterium]